MDNADFVKYRGISRAKSGKWQVRIRSPITKTRIWLGTYSSIREANEAYSKKKLEFESMAPPSFSDSKVKKEEPPKTPRKMKKEEPPKTPRKIKEKPTGVFRRKSGRWYAEIRNPVTGVRGSVGTYETAEEAAEALRRKKEEFGLTKGKKSSVGSPMARAAEIGGNGEGVCGTYDSREDAIDAYSKMKLKLDHEMKKDEPDLEGIISSRSCIRKIRGSVYRVEKGKGRWRWRADIRTKEFRTYLGLYATAEEARAAVDRRISSLESSKAHAITEDSEAHKRKRDEVSVEDDAELAHGRSGEEFDLGVIDANGRLIGEFSRLDDELWLCRSLADDDPYLTQ